MWMRVRLSTQLFAAVAVGIIGMVFLFQEDWSVEGWIALIVSFTFACYLLDDLGKIAREVGKVATKPEDTRLELAKITVWFADLKALGEQADRGRDDPQTQLIKLAKEAGLRAEEHDTFTDLAKAIRIVAGNISS